MTDKTTKKTYKIDLHTHSTLSKDGGVSAREYKRILESGKLHYVVVTDHNEIDFALELHKELGAHLIVGEEIKTKEGEIIGLFLTKKIEPFQSFEATLDQIHAQNGITYLPHPFDTRRSGVNEQVAAKFVDKIDIIERFNARIITPGVHTKIAEFNRNYKKPFAAGSDSHSVWEIGNTYTVIKSMPDKNNFVELLKSPELRTHRVGLRGFLAPTWNKFKKSLKK
ncbi:MAG: hypothetical protein US52_C0065G0002 [candidate division WS6 bacterium GW2011_GWA2_37_6]|uniref:Polymerase/histidinol phosphatase N-terminal domain-containing protein n=1 Tax=candidate division WS6 bacterium GW2011_GWA2_37_6 TaxID=1619087 RepID=A0A0G0GW37_9BACT|nr:MAG: hypothetical protein US52_C0065G0002 [candidate division WS6 bacterium GW2011_GWA2_37_6]